MWREVVMQHASPIMVSSAGLFQLQRGQLVATKKINSMAEGQEGPRSWLCFGDVVAVMRFCQHVP